MKKKTGVQEWADKSFNFQKGCSHDCKYCFARKNAKRFGTIKDDSNWTDVEFCETKAAAGMLKGGSKGVIMFPTTHDITDHPEKAVEYLITLLKGGNRVLLVSKSPKLTWVLCKVAESAPLDKLEVRVSIGSTDDNVLRYYEPKAADFHQRKDALAMAKYLGIKTSVSAEPMLDGNMLDLFAVVKEYISESIWFGFMNYYSFFGENVRCCEANKIELNTPRKTDKALIYKLVELKKKFGNLVQYKDSLKDAIDKNNL